MQSTECKGREGWFIDRIDDKDDNEKRDVLLKSINGGLAGDWHRVFPVSLAAAAAQQDLGKRT